MSIRNQLILHLLIASFILVGGGLGLGYKNVQHEALELFDAQLARSARLILSMVQADTGQNNFTNIQRYLDENQIEAPNQLNRKYTEGEEELSDGHIYETKLGFQIWDDAGNLLIKSPNLPITPFSVVTKGFSNNSYLENNWRVFSLTSQDNQYTCITAERVDVRNDLTGKISADLVTIFIILIPTLLLTMWFTVRQGLSPLYTLASQISRRDAEKLDSLTNTGLPSEILTIADEINQLLSRLKESIDREKRITFDAAHELRTPLAAVKLHAELANTASTDEERKSSITHVLQGIDRTTHLVDQLLSLARLDPDLFSENREQLNFTQLITEEMALLTPLAHSKNIELSICDNPTINMLANDTSLRLLIRNLINNAIAYTQEGGEIDVYLSLANNIPKLIIQDNGPGIPPEDYKRVFERFYRVNNHISHGCGIGLSIVMRVIELHNATLMLDEPEHNSGLIITICFPKL